MSEIKIRWLGHATFELTSAEGKKVLIDPWITGNPACPLEVDALGEVDVILITHDHGDHMGEDMPYLASHGTPEILVQPEILAKLADMGVEEGTGMNIGGTTQAAGLDITMVQAHHSSGCGSPCGYIVTMEDGRKVYHAGDTGIFATMGTLGEMYDIDVAILPIGSHFVMDPEQAAHATRMLRPKRVIPMHYGTFPVLVQDADEFVRLVGQHAPDTEVCVLDPGQTELI